MEKFDLKPFDKVLVRADGECEWKVDLYGYFNFNENEKYYACVGGYYRQCIPYNDKTKHLLGTTDPYKEPYEPKDGDFVYAEGASKHIIIFDRIDNGLMYSHCEVCDDAILLPDHFTAYNIREIRPATEDEKQLLLDKLHEAGKDWDVEKKKFVDWKWKPKKDEEYRTVVFSATTKEFVSCWYHWFGSDVDLNTFEKGWVFKTKEEADKLAKELNEKLFGKEDKE